MRRPLSIVMIIVLLFGLPACETLNLVTDGLSEYLPEWLGGGAQDKIKKKQRPTKKKSPKKTTPLTDEEEDQDNQSEPPTPRWDDGDDNISEQTQVIPAPSIERQDNGSLPTDNQSTAVPSRKTDSTPVLPVSRPREELPSPAIFDADIPIKPLFHLGGRARTLFLSDTHVFVGQERRLYGFDTSLNPIASYDGMAVIESIVVMPALEGQLVYLKEVDRILEILLLDKSGKLQQKKGFQVDHEFDGPYELKTAEGIKHAIYVYFPDKVQVLDILVPETEVITEIPMAQVLQAFPLQDTVVVLHAGGLNIVDSVTHKSLVSLSRQGPQQIIGVSHAGKADELIMASYDPDSSYWRSIQFLRLGPNARSIAQVGEEISLPRGVRALRLDEDQPLLYLVSDTTLHLFDLAKQQLLLGPKPDVIPSRDVRGSGAVLFGIGENEVIRLDFQIKSAPRQSTSTSTDPADSVISVPALPGLGDEPDTGTNSKPEAYQWQGKKIVPLLSSLARLYLLAPQGLWAALRAEGTAANAALGVMPHFEQGQASLVPLPGSEGFKIERVSPTSYGFFLYEKNRGRVYFANKELKNIEEVDLAAQPIQGMVARSQGTNDYLLFTVHDTSKQGLSGLYSYKVENPKLVKKMGFLARAGMGGFALTYNGERAYVACGTEGVCLLNFKGDMKEINFDRAIKPEVEGAQALDVVLDPLQRIAYVYYQSNQGAYISLIDVKVDPPKEVSRLPSVQLTPAQFQGITFSKGGQILIMPDQSGLTFVDVQDTRKPTFKFTWGIGAASFADVTHRGEWVCAALGDYGAECAEIRFEK